MRKLRYRLADRPLEAEIDIRSGCCQYFIIAEPETMEFGAIENYSAMVAGGAGIPAIQKIADRDVEAVLTGNCGPHAYQLLSSVDI